MIRETAFHRFLAFAERHANKHGEGVLGDEYLLLPPVQDFGYLQTPMNALTFCTMGVDGVHFAILQLHGRVQEHSPVVYVSPMDAEAAFVIAGSFLSYLAHGCDVALNEMGVLLSSPLHEEELITLLVENFDHGRLLQKERLEYLARKYAHLIEWKDQEP